MWVNAAPLHDSIFPLENETMLIFELINSTARLGTCAAAYPPEEQWKCLYGQYRLPFVQTPYFLSASQFDAFQVTSQPRTERRSLHSAQTLALVI